jgi:two-component system cell cycle sensor histidine kinase/response regulator CckA
MTIALNLLIIEDSEDDALLLLRELRRGGYRPNFLRVETAGELQHALETRTWDVIISDYSMPKFSAITALQTVRGRGLDLPFIIVSGTIGEQTAVDAMRAGANDYLMKGQLARLIPAVERELREAVSRRERQRAEVARNAAEARFAGVLATTVEAIIAIDSEYRIVLFNQSAERIFGYSALEALGQPLDILLPPEIAKAHRQHIQEYAETPTPARQMGAPGEELNGRRKDGTLFPISASISKWQQHGEAFYTVILQDISHRKNLEAQLLQAQKMEAIGRLAGGIAHDFNNLLTAIIGYSNMLSFELGEQDSRQSDLQEIQKAADRAAVLTRQLLAFSRRQLLTPQVFDLNEVVSDMEKLLRRLIGEDIDLVTLLNPGLGHIRADPGQIEQVIMNLVINARDALPHGGKLTIETANVFLDEGYADHHIAIQPGAHVLLAVSDNGIGMSKETLSHIFEPFFTTKEPGKGTGLGLATVYGIVAQSGGVIQVYSEVGHGTTFEIYFQQVQDTARVVGAPPPARALRDRAATILLAEDDDAVRHLGRRILEQRGYTVLEARHGLDALEIASQYPGPIDLLVTDVIMPEMNGNTLATRLSALRPALKVLYISGYTDLAVTRHGLIQDDSAFLHKPFTPGDFLRVIRERLLRDTT